MENWIGIGIWIILGMLIGMVMKLLVRQPQETAGHSAVLATLGGFAAVIGGMLGVGIFSFDDPSALSVGGMASAAVFAVLMTWIYRWGIRGLV